MGRTGRDRVRERVASDGAAAKQDKRGRRSEMVNNETKFGIAQWTKSPFDIARTSWAWPPKQQNNPELLASQEIIRQGKFFQVIHKFPD